MPQTPSVKVSSSSRLSRRWPLGLGVVGLMVLMLANNFYTLPDASVRLSALPYSGLTYTGQDVPFTHAEETFLSGALGVKRLYHIPGEGDVLLLVMARTTAMPCTTPLSVFAELATTS
ncbi:MAG TPA: hypothetical protein PLV25_02240 [Opitutales bacterium]|nr:hypothetical protein [Opitutales bacterium]